MKYNCTRCLVLKFIVFNTVFILWSLSVFAICWHIQLILRKQHSVGMQINKLPQPKNNLGCGDQNYLSCGEPNFFGSLRLKLFGSWWTKLFGSRQLKLFELRQPKLFESQRPKLFGSRRTKMKTQIFWVAVTQNEDPNCLGRGDPNFVVTQIFWPKNLGLGASVPKIFWSSLTTFFWVVLTPTFLQCKSHFYKNWVMVAFELLTATRSACDKKKITKISQ